MLVTFGELGLHGSTDKNQALGIYVLGSRLLAHDLWPTSAFRRLSLQFCKWGRGGTSPRVPDLLQNVPAAEHQRPLLRTQAPRARQFLRKVQAPAVYILYFVNS